MKLAKHPLKGHTVKTALKLTLVAALALAGVISAGCVAQGELDNQRTLYRKSQEQVADLQARLEEANARIRALQEMLKSGDPDLQEKLLKAIADRDAMAKQLAEALAKAEKGTSYSPIMLEPALDQALRDLAANYPDLMEYDPVHGMVRFKSDLTFAPGSTEVSAEAANALGKLANILRQPIAERYEARVVGHTDNQRIGRADTKAKHPTNWHLSAHRAISVKDVLVRAGVPDIRVGVAGYGEFRPLVPNNGNRGAAQNRRVEIFLVPNTYSGAAVGPTEPAGAAAPATPTVTPEAPAEDGATFK